MRYFLFFTLILFKVAFSQDKLQSFNEKDLLNNTSVVFKGGEFKDKTIRIYNKKNIHISFEKDNRLMLTGKSKLEIFDCEGVTIENVDFENIKVQNSVLIKDSEKIIIKNNNFHRTGIAQNSSAIRIEGRAKRIHILSNNFVDLRSIGIHIVTRRDEESNMKGPIFIEKNKFESFKRVKSVYPNSSGNGMEPIIIGWGYNETKDLKLNTIVANNVFKNIIGDENEVISIKTSGNTVKNNLFLNNIGAVTLRTGNNNSIINNQFVNSNKGIRVFGADHVIEENDFENCKIGIEFRYGDYKAYSSNDGFNYYQAKNVRIHNNKFRNTKLPFKTIKGKAKYRPENISLLDNVILDEK